MLASGALARSAGMQHLKQSEVVTVGDFFLKNLIVTQLL
jgi:hypothetical protein